MQIEQGVAVRADVSIILPCRNEVDFIDSCLASILAQELPALRMEVIVVDGDSEDGTQARLARWEASEPRIVVLDNPRRVVPAALNIAIARATAPVIVRLDVHSWYPPRYVALCLETLARVDAENVGGQVVTMPRGDRFDGKVVQAVTSHSFGVGGARFRVSPKTEYVDTVPFGCFKRSVFERIGMFDERLARNQDYEFNRRIVASGGRVWLNAEIAARYFNQPTINGLLQQAWNTGRWNVWTWWVAPHAFNLRHAVPGIFVLYLLLGAVVSGLSGSAAWLYLAVLLTYGALAAIAAFQQALRFATPALAWALPVVFFGYHVAYGVGIWHGVILLLTRQSPVGPQTRPWPGAPSFRLAVPKGDSR